MLEACKTLMRCIATYIRRYIKAPLNSVKHLNTQTRSKIDDCNWIKPTCQIFQLCVDVWLEFLCIYGIIEKKSIFLGSQTHCLSSNFREQGETKRQLEVVIISGWSCMELEPYHLEFAENANYSSNVRDLVCVVARQYILLPILSAELLKEIWLLFNTFHPRWTVELKNCILNRKLLKYYIHHT